jgi:outer membrane murein-binding lipoprotein Lpp
MSNDKMREEFEAWAFENGMAMHLASAESGLYVSRVTQNYMDCWMASSAEQAAKVEVLTSQVKTLQSDANSYQSGYDAGRAAAKAHADSWRAEAEKLRTALTAIHNEIECNTRCLIRDLVNRASGLNNDVHPNELYDDCDRIEAIIDAAMSKEAGQ